MIFSLAPTKNPPPSSSKFLSLHFIAPGIIWLHRASQEGPRGAVTWDFKKSLVCDDEEARVRWGWWGLKRISAIWWWWVKYVVDGEIWCVFPQIASAMGVLTSSIAVRVRRFLCFVLFEFVLKHIRFMTEMYEVGMMQLGTLFFAHQQHS